MAAKSHDLHNNLLQLPDIRYRYCVCSFMKNIYVIGGGGLHHNTETCLKYTTRDSKWNSIANMCSTRSCAGCTVFEGRIVVSGGWNGLKSVEAYDHHENKWTYLPVMINKR